MPPKRRQKQHQPPWYRRLTLRRRLRVSRDDSGYYSAFLHARPRLGELCAADLGGGDWRPCPMSRCERPDHDHPRAEQGQAAGDEAFELPRLPEQPDLDERRRASL